MTNPEAGDDGERHFSRQTYRLQEVAKILGVGRNQAYEAAKRGEIPSIKVGKRVLVPRAALERLLRGEA
jgi:excisionase family DNA binding protein